MTIRSDYPIILSHTAEVISSQDRTFLFCVATPSGKLSLPSLLPRSITNANVTSERIVEIQAVFGASAPKDLSQLIETCFKVSYPSLIHNFQRNFDDTDLTFAALFGYKIVPSFARLRLSQSITPGGHTNQVVEAWISPVLLPTDHPLTNFMHENAIALFSSKQAAQPPHQPETMAVFGFGEETPKHYIHLKRVPDESLVLATITKIFGDNSINISSVRQPVSPDGITTDVFFIIQRCPTIRFNLALYQISNQFKRGYIAIPVIE